MDGNGFLAIWSDLAPEDETDWVHWMTREHYPSGCASRVSSDAEYSARVNRYFILYDLERPEFVGGAQYLARLNAPRDPAPAQQHRLHGLCETPSWSNGRTLSGRPGWSRTKPRAVVCRHS
jgi:hypothetical protein